MSTTYPAGIYKATPPTLADLGEHQLTLASDASLRVTSQGVTIARSASATFTCGTSAYTAGDVVGAASAAAALTFASIGPSAGGGVMITSASLEIDTAALIASEAGYVLHLFSVTPPSALNEGDAFVLAAGDRASYLGSITLGTPVDLGSTLYVEVNGLDKQIVLASGSLYGYLVTAAGYTPTARVFLIKLHSLAL